MKTYQTSQTLILLVDDEPQVLGEVSTVLKAAGYACHCCSNAAAAMESAREATPDLIISDIQLQGETGLEMCEKMRQELSLYDVPVMFLSGAQIPDIIRRSHAAGGTYYLRKPFDPEVLVELVEKALWMPHVARSRSARTAATMAR